MQPHHDQPATTIAILGSDTVVGSALCALLEGHGYRTVLLDSHPTGVVDELLQGVDLLLLTPRVDEGVREAFLGAMGKSTPRVGRVPVIELSATATGDPPDEGGVRSAPWPSPAKALVERIEAALAGAPAAPTSPTADPSSLS